MSTPAEPPTQPDAGPVGSLLDAVTGLWKELPELINDRVELLSLELHRAGLVLLQITALGIAATILGLTAWVSLWGAISALLVACGISWLAALFAVSAVNLVTCWWVASKLRALLPLVGLPATRRHLMFRSSSATNSPLPSAHEPHLPANPTAGA